MPRQTKLQGIRKDHGLTQKEMAEIIGLSEASYVARETGRIDFKLTEMKKISEYFKIPYEKIFLT